MSLEAGSKLGPYEILSPITTNGGLEVYKASDTQQNRTVAIKVIHLDGRDDAAEVRELFEQEMQRIASLNHPNICGPQEIGRDGDIDFIVTEFLEGDSLAARLERGALKL